MRLTILCRCFLFICFISVSQLLSGQSLGSGSLQNIDIDRVSDEEISAYYQRAKASGLSDDQLFKLAADRGLSAEQAAKLRVRIANLPLGGKKAATPTSTPSAPTDINRQVTEDAKGPAMRRVVRDTTIYGSELFTEVSSVFEPNYKIATPANYTLGPGDQLVIQVFGYSEQTYNVTVNAEGSIYIPNVGPISVSGIQLSEATERIRNKLASTIYRAIRTGQTRVEVTLGSIRTISVSVIGQAFKPGTYSVSSLTTLFNLLYLSGGPNDQGSYRGIELIRGNKVYRTADLYGFLLRGDRKDNLLLQDQDVVRIPYYQIRVSLTGEVKRSGKFEMLPNESLDQLLTFGGGYSDSAYRGLIKVIRQTDEGRQLASIKPTDFAGFKPKTGDQYIVDKALSRYLNRVRIEGAVYRPGAYELAPGMMLQDLITLAGGLTQDAYTERGFIARLDDDLQPTALSFNAESAAAGTENIALKREDIVTISSQFDLQDATVVEVHGQVRQPGRFNYRENLQLRDILIQAGGFTEMADYGTVEIARRVKSGTGGAESFQVAEIIQIDVSGGLNSAAAAVELQPYDLISVRSLGSFERQRVVYLDGEVQNPGTYGLQTTRDRISSLLRRGGGFKNSADSGSVTIRRISRKDISEQEKQRIAQRLLRLNSDSLFSNPELQQEFFNNVDVLSVNVNRIKSDPGGNEDLILEDGDLVQVSRASSLLRVSGEVYHPGLLPFEEETSSKYYINRSGSFTSNARKSRTFVVYPDGRAKSVKKFLFFKNYPEVTPRSEIYVPSKDKEGRPKMSTGEWIAISSIVATLATMAVTIINATK